MSEPRSLEELARLVDGILEGDPAIRVRRLQSLDRAEAGDLAFVAGSRRIARIRLRGAAPKLIVGDAHSAVEIVGHDAPSSLKARGL